MTFRWTGALGGVALTSMTGCRAEGLVAAPVSLGRLILTDGRNTFHASLTQHAGEGSPRLVFDECCPPPMVELEVLDLNLDRPGHEKVICFTAGTPIETSAGPRAVETLHPGDKIWTRDNGYREILWVGRRRISGAALATVPSLRPVELARGVLVSPEHRVLVGGDNGHLTAAHRLNEGRMRRVLLPKGVVYVHLMLAQHELIRSAGIDSETFHPAGMPLASLAPPERMSLTRLFPGIAKAPDDYGPTVRPVLEPGH